MYLTRFYAFLAQAFHDPVQPLYRVGEVVYVAVSGQ
jgi:hypothetical protein